MPLRARRAKQQVASISSATSSSLALVYDYIKQRILSLKYPPGMNLAEVDFGAWEGLTIGEARTSHPAELDAWLAAPDSAPPGGESFAQVAGRVQRARDEIVRAHPDNTVLHPPVLRGTGRRPADGHAARGAAIQSPGLTIAARGRGRFRPQCQHRKH